MNGLLKHTVDIVKTAEVDVSFTILEIGAVALGGTPEPFYELLDYFPSSKIIGFEIEEDVCNKMNVEGRTGVDYFPFALGKTMKKGRYISPIIQCVVVYINQTKV